MTRDQLNEIVMAFEKWFKKSPHAEIEDDYANKITFERISKLPQKEFEDFFFEFAQKGGKIQTGGARTAGKLIKNVHNNFAEFKKNILLPFQPDFTIGDWIQWVESFKYFGKGLATIYLNRVNKLKYVIVNNKSIEAYKELGYEIASSPLIRTYNDLLQAQTDLIHKYPSLSNFFRTDALSEFLIGQKEGRELVIRIKKLNAKVQLITKDSVVKAIEKIDNNPDLRKRRESIEYDLIYNSSKYPPILVLSEANKIEGGQELLLTDFGNSTKSAFSILETLGFKIEKKKIDFSSQLQKFINQSEKGGLSTSEYIGSFEDLKVKVGFGKGNEARIPWIAFLSEGNTVQKGIYPVYLYYKSKKILILAYGVSETNTPSTNWDLSNPIYISTFFEENNLGRPERYGSSFVYKTYKDIKSLRPDDINRDLSQLIDIYKQKIAHRPTIESVEQIDFNYNSFKESLDSANLLFDKKVIIRFISSLVTKPFVILTGLSGSGKTKLAQAFAKWLCQYESQYCIVPVGADWTNREPLLGYPNALKQEEYVKPDNKVLDLIDDANKNPDLPYFLILDEMNLSHVERYFADFLSVMESGEEITLFSEGEAHNGVPAKLKLPSNLFIIGTVNIDETTYMFSPKVLDRANTIEFRVTKQEIEQFFLIDQGLDMSAIVGKGASMAYSFLKIAANKKFKEINTTRINKTFVSFFEQLKKTGAEFGFRTATEIIRLINQLSVINPEINENDKVDIAIMQKLLPKLHGSRRKLCPVLITLGSFCVTEQIGNVEKEVFEKEEFEFTSTDKIKYPLSLEKLSRMYKGAVDNGFASFSEA